MQETEFFPISENHTLSSFVEVLSPQSMKIMENYKNYFIATELPTMPNTFFELRIPRSCLDNPNKNTIKSTSTIQEQAMNIFRQIVVGLVNLTPSDTSSHQHQHHQTTNSTSIVGTSPLLHPSNSPIITSNTSTVTINASRRSMAVNSTQLNPLIFNTSPQIHIVQKNIRAVSMYISRILYDFENLYVFGPNLTKLTLTAEEFENIDAEDEDDELNESVDYGTF